MCKKFPMEVPKSHVVANISQPKHVPKCLWHIIFWIIKILIVKICLNNFISSIKPKNKVVAKKLAYSKHFFLPDEGM